MHSRKFFINCSDVDENRLLKPSSFFKLFQDLAVESTEVIGFGHSYLDPKHLTWVITRVSVEFIDMPKYQQNIVISTYPGKSKRIIYPRHFFIHDEDNNLLARMSSTWALIDVNSHNVSYLSEEDFRLDIGSSDIELPLPKHIKVEDEGEYVMSRIVRYSDVDLNTHLNNTRYIDFIFDLFDSKFNKEYEIKTIQVDYLSEIKEGQKVDLFKTGNNPYQIIGKVEDKVCFIASLGFIKKEVK